MYYFFIIALKPKKIMELVTLEALLLALCANIEMISCTVLYREVNPYEKLLL